jgi:hypothetical protein
MTKNCFVKSTLITAATVLSFMVTAAIAQEHEHAMKVGKTGDITFSEETKVGDLTLKPGRYQFQHRVEGSDHFVNFTEWTKPNKYTLRSGSPKAHVGEVKCRLEPLQKKASETRIYVVQEDGVRRMSKVEIAGENVAHVF